MLDSTNAPHRLLVVLPTWVGDFVMATPFLRVVRERFRDSEITFLVEPNLVGLLAGGDWMDRHVVWPEKAARNPFRRTFRDFIAGLRHQFFDLAILLPNSFRSALVARLAGVRRRIGYDRDARGWLLSDRIQPRNRCNGRFEPLPLVEYYADLAVAIGCRRPTDQLELFTTTDCDATVERRLLASGISGRHPLIVLSPGARFGAAKCWFPERFAAVADRWVEEHGAAAVVTCGPGEEPIAEAICRHAKYPHSAFINPLLSLGELKSLIRRADLLICNDAGPRHFAKAFGVPVVTVFGPTHPQWTATTYPAERIVRIDVDCGPCQQRVCPLGHLKCMTGVTIDAVYQAGSELLQDHLVSSGVRG